MRPASAGGEVASLLAKHRQNSSLTPWSPGTPVTPMGRRPSTAARGRSDVGASWRVDDDTFSTRKDEQGHLEQSLSKRSQSRRKGGGNKRVEEPNFLREIGLHYSDANESQTSSANFPSNRRSPMHEYHAFKPRASPLVQQQEEAENDSLRTVINDQREALQEAEKVLEQVLAAKYSNTASTQSSRSSVRPNIAGTLRPRTADSLRNAGQLKPTSKEQTADWIKWHLGVQAQELAIAKDEAVRDIEVRIHTQMVEREKHHLSALGILESEMGRNAAKRREQHDAVHTAFEQCKDDLIIQQDKCQQLEREVTAQIDVEKTLISFVGTLVAELADLGNQLSKEVKDLEERQRQEQMRKRNPHRRQQNKELFVMGEVTARLLQTQNEEMFNRISELKIEMHNRIQQLLDRDGGDVLRLEIETQKEEIEDLQGKISTLERMALKHGDSKTNLKVNKTDDEIESELKVFEKQVVAADQNEAMVRNRNEEMRKSSGKVAIFGGYSHFLLGLDEYYGTPPAGDDAVLLKRMEMEFNKHQEIVTSNYGGIRTNLRLEWDFVVDPASFQKNAASCHQLAGGIVFDESRGDDGRYPVRTPTPLSVFENHPLRLKAGLTKSEVVGLRLYAGPAYQAINTSLRTLLSDEHTKAATPRRKSSANAHIQDDETDIGTSIA
jgi:hypothetical protein